MQLARDGTALLLQPRLNQLREPPVLLELALGLLRAAVLGDVAHAADLADHFAAWPGRSTARPTTRHRRRARRE